MRDRELGQLGFVALAWALLLLAILCGMFSCATPPRRPSNPLWPDCRDSCVKFGGHDATLMEDDDHLVCVCKKPAVQPMAFGGGSEREP